MQSGFLIAAPLTSTCPGSGSRGSHRTHRRSSAFPAATNCPAGRCASGSPGPSACAPGRPQPLGLQEAVDPLHRPRAHPRRVPADVAAEERIRSTDPAVRLVRPAARSLRNTSEPEVTGVFRVAVPRRRSPRYARCDLRVGDRTVQLNRARISIRTPSGAHLIRLPSRSPLRTSRSTPATQDDGPVDAAVRDDRQVADGRCWSSTACSAAIDPTCTIFPPTAAASSRPWAVPVRTTVRLTLAPVGGAATRSPQPLGPTRSSRVRSVGDEAVGSLEEPHRRVGARPEVPVRVVLRGGAEGAEVPLRGDEPGHGPDPGGALTVRQRVLRSYPARDRPRPQAGDSGRHGPYEPPHDHSGGLAAPRGGHAGGHRRRARS